MNKEELLESLKEFKHYKRNWDSYNAKPLNKKDLKNAESFINYCIEHHSEELDRFNISAFNGGISIDVSENNDFFMGIDFSLKQVKVCFYRPTPKLPFRVLIFNPAKQENQIWKIIMNEMEYQLQVIKRIKKHEQIEKYFKKC